jgi:hypothetical protein
MSQPTKSRNASQLSCREGHQHDINHAREPLGWHKICLSRAGKGTASRRRRTTVLSGKLHVKAKRFQAYCRSQVKAGLINHADGSWRPASTIHAMDLHMRAGYRLA